MFRVQRQVDNALALKLDAFYRGLRLHVRICMHAMDRGGTYLDKHTKELTVGCIPRHTMCQCEHARALTVYNP